MLVVVVLQAKASPDLVGADDDNTHGHHFSSLGALTRSPVYSIDVV
jgi:hypothetical protein